MEIKNKPTPDPLASNHMVDAYMRWALQAAEEVLGKQGLTIVLRDNGLEKYVDNYPPEELKISGNVTNSDYANLCTGLLQFYGRAGKSVDYRIGRISSKYAIEKQAAVFNVAARMAVRLLPFQNQISTGLDNLIGGFQKLWSDFGEEAIILKEDRGDSFAYIQQTCPTCAGKQADEPICHQTTGMLLESIEWLTGKKVLVKEVECRAMGDPACVWEISKTPDE
ncbi:MAG: 4-vinyl reductase [Chloroflexi bacterium]|nr:4-vinyl reductase [Chloroflexota bacterium]